MTHLRQAQRLVTTYLSGQLHKDIEAATGERAPRQLTRAQLSERLFTLAEQTPEADESEDSDAILELAAEFE